MQSELKPCPFCGSDKHMLLSPTCDRSTPYNPADRAFPVVRCGGCYTDVPGRDFDACGKSAIEAWNRRAAISDQERAVEVKALEWVGDGDCYAFADVIHQSYSIAYEEGKYWANWDMVLPPFDTLQAAQAAAQADYEQRIRSALVDVPVEPVAKQWCAYEDGQQHTSWYPDGYGDRTGWEALAKRNPAKYQVVTRDLFAHPPLTREGEDSAEVERLREAARRIVPYLRWTIGDESPGFHPTMRSAVGAFMSAFGWPTEEDWQDDMRRSLAATRSGSATTASGTSPIRQRGESDA
jgi:hypothetical protein